MRTRLTNKLVLAAATVAVLAVPAVAHASQIGETGITLTCDDESPDPGSSFNCGSGGWLGNSNVDVLAELNPVLLDDTFTADANGNITFTVNVPDDAPDGDITITLTGTDANGNAVTAAEEAAVVGDEAAGGDADGDADGDTAVDTDGEEIADTGADAGVLALGAVLAVGLGSAALFAARKRTTA